MSGATQRKPPEDNPLRAVACRREGIGSRGIAQQPLLAGPSARAGIAPIGQRDEAGTVSGDASKMADERSQEITIAGKIDHGRMARSRRHVPDNDLLAIRRRQNMFFRFRKAGSFGSGAYGLRDRKHQRPLREEQDRKTAEIAARGENDEPFQDGHDFP